jgi:hypothetical protein
VFRPEVEEVVEEVGSAEEEPSVSRAPITDTRSAGVGRWRRDPSTAATSHRSEESAARITLEKRPDYIYHRLLAGSDVISILLATALASLVTAAVGRGYELGMIAVTVAIMIPAWFAMAYVAGLYHEVERRIDYNFVDEIGKIVVVATAWSWIFVLVRSLLVVGETDQLTPALIWLMMVPILLFGRALVRRYARRRPWSRRAVAVIGGASDVEALVSRIERHSEWGLDVRLEVISEPGDIFVVNDGCGLTSFGQSNPSERKRRSGKADPPQYPVRSTHG